MNTRWLALLLTACGSSCAERRPDEAAGRVVLARVAPDPATLLDAPAEARYCARDSLLSIVAVTRDWSFALGARTAWPPDTSRRVGIVLTPNEAGTAALAARPLNDSASAALQASTGSVTIARAAPLSGEFEAIAGSDSAATRLRGRFSGLRVADRCPE